MSTHFPEHAVAADEVLGGADAGGKRNLCVYLCVFVREGGGRGREMGQRTSETLVT